MTQERFQFGPATEKERAARREKQRQCVEILRACKPLTTRLATIHGIYTDLSPDDERLLQAFHWVVDAHQGDKYESTFDGLCSSAGLLHSDVGLLSGRLQTLYQQREPVLYEAEACALLHQWLRDREDSEGTSKKH